MERWENRYAHSRTGGARGMEHSRMERIRSIAIILLAVALVGVGIVGGRAMTFRKECGEALISRALVECSSAVSQVNTMSRSGGSDTPAALAKVRANIRAMEMFSELKLSLYGQPLAPAETFVTLYSHIDGIYAKLANGINPLNELTQLADGLKILQTMLEEQ